MTGGVEGIGCRLNEADGGSNSALCEASRAVDGVIAG